LASLRSAIAFGGAPVHAPVSAYWTLLALAVRAMVCFSMTPRLAADEVVIIMIVRSALCLANWAPFAFALVAMSRTGAPALAVFVSYIVLVCR